MHHDSLPPVQLLIAFEAAGRYLSFKRAARELAVTPSAVSQQIRSLEETLGEPLFVRTGRSVELTPAGLGYLARVTEALGILRRATADLRERSGKSTLRVSADAVVAYEVIIPGLPDFERRYPDLELCLETSSALADLHRDTLDAAVRFGRGPWPNVAHQEIAKMQCTVVAAPSLLREKPLRSPGDLGRHTLLEVEGAPDHWTSAATELGFRIGRRQKFDSYLATLQAAAHGVGVALGLFPLSTSWVREGRLRAPLYPQMADAYSYHLVYRPEEQESRKLAALHQWLRERFATLPPLALC